MLSVGVRKVRARGEVYIVAETTSDVLLLGEAGWIPWTSSDWGHRYESPISSPAVDRLVATGIENWSPVRLIAIVRIPEAWKMVRLSTGDSLLAALAPRSEAPRTPPKRGHVNFMQDEYRLHTSTPNRR